MASKYKKPKSYQAIRGTSPMSSTAPRSSFSQTKIQNPYRNPVRKVSAAKPKKKVPKIGNQPANISYPHQAPPPSPPKLTALAPKTFGALPETQGARLQADATLEQQRARLGQSVYNAALRYGDKNALDNFKQFGPVVDNPNSELASIERNELKAKETVGNNRNRGNTFFSGMHMKDRDDLSFQAASQRAEAEQRYQSALQDYYQALAEAVAKKDQTYYDADQAEYDYALKQDPALEGEIDPNMTYPQEGGSMTGATSAPKKKKKAKPKPKPKKRKK